MGDEGIVFLNICFLFSNNHNVNNTKQMSHIIKEIKNNICNVVVVSVTADTIKQHNNNTTTQHNNNFSPPPVGGIASLVVHRVPSFAQMNAGHAALLEPWRRSQKK